MAKDISIAQQVFYILENAGRPLFLREIVQALGEDFNAMYVQPSVINLMKTGTIKSEIKTVRTTKGERGLKVYFIKDV